MKIRIYCYHGDWYGVEDESWRNAEFEDAEEAIRHMAELRGPDGSIGWYMYQVWVEE